MCTGIREWEKELLSEGVTKGVNIAYQILYDLKNVSDETNIMNKYNVNPTEVLKLKEILQA